jgi:hypothetical protein
MHPPGLHAGGVEADLTAVEEYLAPREPDDCPLALAGDVEGVHDVLVVLVQVRADRLNFRRVIESLARRVLFERLREHRDHG